MNKVRFVAAARRELLAQITYYNEKQAGLGELFTSAIEKTTALALAFPLVGSPFSANTRRLIVNGFSFSIIYKPYEGDVIIFAIAHHSRRPNYWQSRITE